MVKSKKRVLIVDSDTLFRIGLRSLCADIMDDPELRETASSDEASELAGGGSEFDLITLGQFPHSECDAATVESFRRWQPNASIVLVTSGTARGDMVRAIRAGASGVIQRMSSVSEIVTALNVIDQGGLFLPKVDASVEAMSAIRGDTPNQTRNEVERAIEKLTKRQREVLVLLAQGLSNLAIAEKLGASEHTIRIHVSAILKVLGASNRTKAAIIAAPLLFDLASGKDGSKNSFSMGTLVR